MKKEDIVKIFMLCLIVVSGLVAMSMDYEDELKEHQYYCDSVADGTHPDYKGIYHEQC